MAASSWTRTWPRLTFWPSSKLIDFTRLATSGRSTTDSLERKVPTAVTVSRLWPTLGFVASTYATGGPERGALAAAAGAAAPEGARLRPPTVRFVPAPGPARKYQ